MRLGIENHKGWRSAEQAAWLKRVSSEWVGVHFDFGNNVSLCEDPALTLRNLLPYTFACHIKDMAIESLTLLRGHLSPRVLGLVTEWAALHRSELIEDWKLARAEAALKPIAPLE